MRTKNRDGLPVKSQRHHEVQVSKANDPSRLLSEPEPIEKLKQFEQLALSCAPAALKVIADTMRSGSDHLKFMAAVQICKMAGITGVGPIRQAVAAPDQKVHEERYKAIGIMMSTFVEKAEKYKMPFPKRLVDGFRNTCSRIDALCEEIGYEEDEKGDKRD